VYFWVFFGWSPSLYVQKLLANATMRAYIATRHAEVLQELELIVAAVLESGAQSASEN
jgi:hypothetical protein